LLESILDLRYRCFTITSFALLFRKEKYIKSKKQLVQISSRFTAYAQKIFTNVYTVHVYEYIFAKIWSIWILWGPPKCIVPTPGLTLSIPCAVCVFVHTHAPTYAPTRVKNRKTKDNTSISPSVHIDPPCQATSALHRLVEPPTLVPQRE